MLSEFEFIDKISQKYGLTKIGDDCAVLPKDEKTDLVVTADLLVEEIDFRLDWTTPELLGHKALAVSLSDIAAMGANPVWAMLSLGIPESIWKTDFTDKFYDGWYRLAQKFGIELVGGDISRSPDKLFIDSIAGGEVPKGTAILRSGAKVGDAVIVAGTLGGAAGGLRLLENGVRFGLESDEIGGELFQKQLKPEPQLHIANILRNLHIVTSMIDLSDGLSSDLGHLCQSSGVGARIYTEKLPVHLALHRNFTPNESLDMALNGGEDFELLFTAAENNISKLDMNLISVIGEITANTCIIELIRDGKTEILEPKGYRHF